MLAEIHQYGLKAPEFYASHSGMNPFTGAPCLAYDEDHGYLKVVENVFHFIGPSQQYETIHSASCLTGYRIDSDDRRIGEGSALMNAVLGGAIFGAGGAILGALLMEPGHPVADILTLTLYFDDGIDTHSGGMDREVIDFLADTDPENPSEVAAAERALGECVAILHRIFMRYRPQMFGNLGANEKPHS